MEEPHPQKFVLMSLAATPHIVEAFHQVSRALSEERLVQHAGLSPDHWYAGSASSTYQRLGISSVRLFRPRGSREPWWLDQNIEHQFAQAIPRIRHQVRERIASIRPDAFILGDDNGPLEILVIRVVEECGVPVVYVEHAPDLRALVWPTRTQQTWRALRSLPGQLRRLSSHVGNRRLDPAALRPRPKRDTYPVCAYSGMSVELLRRLGVAEHRIRNTGFPWMDVIVGSSRREPGDRSHERGNKILCVSSGWALFGVQHGPRSDSFFKLVIGIAKALPDEYTLTFRPKGDELNLNSASRRWVDALHGAGVRIAETDLPSYEAIQNFDVVMGDVTSVLIEAIVSRIPTVLLHHADVPDRSNPYKLETLLSERFSLLSIPHPAAAERILGESLTLEYLRHQEDRLHADDGYSFPRPDGRCASRVANEILRATSV